MYVVPFTMIENTVMGVRKGDYEFGLVYIEKITSGLLICESGAQRKV